MSLPCNASHIVTQSICGSSRAISTESLHAKSVSTPEEVQLCLTEPDLPMQIAFLFLYMLGSHNASAIGVDE